MEVGDVPEVVGKCLKVVLKLYLIIVDSSFSGHRLTLLSAPEPPVRTTSPSPPQQHPRTMSSPVPIGQTRPASPSVPIPMGSGFPRSGSPQSPISRGVGAGFPSTPPRVIQVPAALILRPLHHALRLIYPHPLITTRLLCPPLAPRCYLETLKHS